MSEFELFCLWLTALFILVKCVFTFPLFSWGGFVPQLLWGFYTLRLLTICWWYIFICICFTVCRLSFDFVWSVLPSSFFFLIALLVCCCCTWILNYRKPFSALGWKNSPRFSFNVCFLLFTWDSLIHVCGMIHWCLFLCVIWGMNIIFSFSKWPPICHSCIYLKVHLCPSDLRLWV